MDGGDRRDRLQEFLDWAVASGIDPAKLPEYRRFGEAMFARTHGRGVTETHILAVADAHEADGAAAAELIEEVGDAILRWQEYQRNPDKAPSAPLPPTREIAPPARETPAAREAPAPRDSLSGREALPGPRDSLSGRESLPPRDTGPRRQSPVPAPLPTPLPVSAPTSLTGPISDAPPEEMPPVWTQRTPSRPPVPVPAPDQPAAPEKPALPSERPVLAIGTERRDPTPAPAPRTEAQDPAPPAPASDPATRKKSLEVLGALVAIGVVLFLAPRLFEGTGGHVPGSRSVAGRHASQHLGVSVDFPKGWRHLPDTDAKVANVTTAPIYGGAPLGLDPKALTIFNLSGIRLSSFYRGAAPPRQQATAIIGLAVAAGPPHWKTNVGTTHSLVNYGATLVAKALPSAGLFHAPRCENVELSTTIGRCVMALDPGYLIVWFTAMRDGYAFVILHSPRPLPDALAEGDELVDSLRPL